MLQFQNGDHIAHSYIVASVSGEARTRMATELAAAMLCEAGGVRPCRSCRSCHKVFHGVHPDVLCVEPDGAGKNPSIKIEQIRSIAATAYILPSEAERKVYILHQADSMNFNAQNAFLKLLEEPPRSAAFILSVQNPGALLATVRSRCELLRENAEQPPSVQTDEGPALEYLQIAAQGRRAEQFRWCAAQESMDAQALQAFLTAARALLVRQLAGEEAVPGMSMQAALRELARLEQCDAYRRANVNTKHIFGWLSLPLSERTPAGKKRG